MINLEDIKKIINEDTEGNIWNEYSVTFTKFWDNLILDDKISSIDESDIDPIIRILDAKAKGNSKGSIVVAQTGIRQSMWYRTFRSIKEHKEIRDALTKIFKIENDNELIISLNDFEKINKKYKNGLSGGKAVILNSLLFINNPQYFLCMTSIEHREKVIQNLIKEKNEDIGFGQKIINSNRKILIFFETLNISINPRMITKYLYEIRKVWDPDENVEINATSENELVNSEEQVFVLEKYFEDFLIGNWESTELGRKYELIFSEDGDLLSQQYKTTIGTIDILTKEKETGIYTVFELKRNQTSDDTVGQILRYISWVKKNLAKDKIVNGVIIGYNTDEKLKYAISDLPHIKLFLYRIKFSLITPAMNFA